MMRYLSTVVGGLLVLGLSSMTTSAAVPSQKKAIGRVMDVTGGARIVAENGKRRRARIGGTVYAKERLQLADKASVVVAFRKPPRREQVTGKRDVELTERGFAKAAQAKTLRVPKDSRLKVVAQIGQIPGGGAGVATLRADSPLLPRVSPVHTSVVLQSRPAFHWAAVPGATGYEVIVYDIDDEEVWFTESKEPRATFDGEPLTPGAVYRWEVVASLENGESRSIRLDKQNKLNFKVASRERQQMARKLDQLTPKDLEAAAAHMLGEIVLFYLDGSHHNEALPAIERLLKKRPQDAFMTAQLARVQQLAGLEKYQQTRDKAKKLGFEFPEDAAKK